MKKISLIVSVFLILLCFSACGSGGVCEYDDPETYTEYTGEVVYDDAEGKVTCLSVAYLSGEVEIVRGDGFVISEQGTFGEYYPLYYRFGDRSLEIQYARSGTEHKSIGKARKKLVLTVPDHVREVVLDLVSADYSVTGGEFESIRVGAVSGDGKIDVGCVAAIGLACVSGNAEITVRDCSATKMIEVDHVSGNTTLTLCNAGRFKLAFSTLSGIMDSDFTVSEEDAEVDFEVRVSTVSGNLSLQKAAGEEGEEDEESESASESGSF